MGEFLTNDDQLFRDDLSDIANNAILNYDFKQFPPYADGYRIAADVLVKSCIYQMPFGRGDIDVLIYPIVFNYRHYVELRLKEIIIGLKHCHGIDENVKLVHDIKILWSELKKLYQEFEEDNNTEDFENAERVIFEFAKIDPRSTAFRYPTQTMSKVNIRNFGEVMDRLANFLDCLSDLTEHYRDLTDEMYKDYY
jgi:hypothetical protein